MKDPLFKPGDIVDVDWKKEVRGNKGSSLWKNNVVLETRVFVDKNLYVILKGHPMCPVPQERLSLAKTSD